MPHIPDLRAHDTHDLELVAAFAAGDAAGADLETASTLVAGCASCAALHHDLRAIAAALPQLPPPARPRDFRLTPEQAAGLRPTGWRRLAAALAGPSFRFAAPLGTGLAALGIAGILLGSLASVPLGAGGAARDVTAGAGVTDLSHATGAPAAQAPSAVPSEAAEMPVRASGGDSVPAASPNPAFAGQESAGVDTAGGAGAGTGAPGESPDEEVLPPPNAAGPLRADDAGPTTPTDGSAGAGERSSGELLGIVGAAALLVGLALLALRWSSRRLA